MKIEQYVLVFFILVLVAVVSLQSKITNQQVLDDRTVEYNRNVDRATDDALSTLIESVDGYDKELNLEKCAESFFNSLYASFGILDNESGQEILEKYVPVLLVTADDGFYVLSHYLSDDGTHSEKQWSVKMPYCYSGFAEVQEGNGPVKSVPYTINFTMSNKVQVLYNNSVKEGDWDDLVKKSFGAQDDFAGLFRALSNGDGAFFQNQESFEAFKHSAMQYQIAKKVNYYVNAHNAIAEQYGINYSFSLPVSSTDDFARTVEDVTVMAIFQGYPFGVGMEDTYSRFAVAGARLFKKQGYYINKKRGVKYYHRPECSEAIGTEYDSKQECAVMGAYPCEKCNP